MAAGVDEGGAGESAESPAGGATVTIVPFRREHAAAFAELNREWLVAHELLEPEDEPELVDPEGEVLAKGGAILVAVRGPGEREVVGVCGIKPHGPGEMELVKLAVARPARGLGIGRRLVAGILAWARQRGARRIVLLSSSRLGAALRLYEGLGFRHAAMPPADRARYATADVFMALELDAPTAARVARD